MTTQLIFVETGGKKTISGQVEVRDGTVTVTAPDGRVVAADIEESMLSPETLAKALLLELSRRGEAAEAIEA